MAIFENIELINPLLVKLASASPCSTVKSGVWEAQQCSYLSDLVVLAMLCCLRYFVILHFIILLMITFFPCIGSNSAARWLDVQITTLLVILPQCQYPWREKNLYCGFCMIYNLYCGFCISASVFTVKETCWVWMVA